MLTKITVCAIKSKEGCQSVLRETPYGEPKGQENGHGSQISRNSQAKGLA